MKISIEIDPQKNPCELGEFLRSEFFKEEIGCYSCFEWSKEVESLSPVLVEGEDDIFWTRGQKKIGFEFAECWYYWDGDGTLVFSGKYWCLATTDCKKDYEWKYYRSLNQFLDQEE